MKSAPLSRRRFLHASCAGLLALGLPPRAFGNAQAVLVGLDAEFLDRTSTADEAIQFGAQWAIDHVNARGGVLGGRPLQLITTDNRSVPARGVANVQRLAAMPDLVAFLCAKFSPVALEQVPHFHDARLPLLNPWAAADAIVDNHRVPNYAFRVGLRDSIAMERLLQEMQARGLHEVGLVVPSTAWGRSCHLHAERFISADPSTALKMVGVEWHRWGNDNQIGEAYRSLVARGARAILLVANEPEGSALVRAVAGLPAGERRPIFSHWGITGGRFTELCGVALQEVELDVVQSFSFARAQGPEAAAIAQAAMKHFGAHDALAVPSMTGLGPAYDLVRMLALAIDLAGSTNRPVIRDALEQLPPYDGLVRRFAPAFTPSRHEALDLDDVLICHFDDTGRLAPRQLG